MHDHRASDKVVGQRRGGTSATIVPIGTDGPIISCIPTSEITNSPRYALVPQEDVHWATKAGQGISEAGGLMQWRDMQTWLKNLILTISTVLLDAQALRDGPHSGIDADVNQRLQHLFRNLCEYPDTTFRISARGGDIGIDPT